MKRMRLGIGIFLCALAISAMLVPLSGTNAQLSPSTNSFIVEDGSTEPPTIVGFIDDEGNIQLADGATIHQNADSEDLDPTSANEILVECPIVSPFIETVARWDGSTGDLYIKGDFVYDCDATGCSCPPDPTGGALRIEDNNGTLVAFIDCDGNLVTRGLPQVDIFVTDDFVCPGCPCGGGDDDIVDIWFNGVKIATSFNLDTVFTAQRDLQVGTNTLVVELVSAGTCNENDEPGIVVNVIVAGTSLLFSGFEPEDINPATFTFDHRECP